VRGRASVIAFVRYNRVKEHPQKYSIGDTADTCKKHRNTQCDYIVTDLLKSLLGNGSVNTFQHTRGHARVEVFSMWSVSRNSTRAVFSAWSVPRLYYGSVFLTLSTIIREVSVCVCVCVCGI
jgi:hypothetical protein